MTEMKSKEWFDKTKGGVDALTSKRDEIIRRMDARIESLQRDRRDAFDLLTTAIAFLEDAETYVEEGEYDSAEDFAWDASNKAKEASESQSDEEFEELVEEFWDEANDIHWNYSAALDCYLEEVGDV